jgi:ubiquinone/menaquinone biosynthesis C-methylase UbiE
MGQLDMQENAFKQEVRRHFDERADRYDQDTENCDQQDFENFETIIPYMLQHSGERILEVAAGTGIVLEMLLKAGKDAYGMDFSTGLLDVASSKRGISKDRLFCEDAERLSFADQSFDSTCIFRSLHHIDNPAAALKEMARCAKKSVFVYDSAGEWRRLAKMTLKKAGLYQLLYSLLRGQSDTGYRPPTETEGPVKVFYGEDAIPILKDCGLRIARTMKLSSNLFIHAEK